MAEVTAPPRARRSLTPTQKDYTGAPVRNVGTSFEESKGRRIVKPRVVTDTATPTAAPIEQPRKPSFNAQDTIPKNLERFDLGSALKDIYKKNASKFGPDTKTGGRDIYEMKGGERTGRILESSSWLPEGKAFSNNAWQETVGGQPNMNYDPKAIMPEGYTNDAGTFIPGPRVKSWEPMYNARNQGERNIAMQEFAKKAGQLDPETGRIGNELARRGDQKLEGIKGRYLESAAKIGASADVQSSGIRAGADVQSAEIQAAGRVGKAQEADWGYNEGSNKYYNKKSPVNPAQQMTELSPDIQATINKIRSNPEELKKFYMENEALWPALDKYLKTSDSFR